MAGSGLSSPPDGRRQLDAHRRQRLPGLERGGRPCGSPERDHAPRQRDRRVDRRQGAAGTALGVVGEVDAVGRRGVDRGDQVAPHRIGEVRHERGEQAGDGGQHLVQGGVRGALVVIELALPEAAPVAPHVPVREVVDERLDPARRARRVVRVQRGARLADHRVEARQDPAVEQGPRRAPASAAEGVQPSSRA